MRQPLGAEDMAGLRRAAGKPEARARGHRGRKRCHLASESSLGLPTVLGGYAEPASLPPGGMVVEKKDGDGALEKLTHTGFFLALARAEQFEDNFFVQFCKCN